MEGAGLSAKYAAAQLTGIGELQRFFPFFPRGREGSLPPSVPFYLPFRGFPPFISRLKERHSIFYFYFFCGIINSDV